MGARAEIDRLAEFLMRYYQDDIGTGDPVHGESAVDVAIRLLSENIVRQIVRDFGDSLTHIVGSGGGYFVRFGDHSPLMDSDPLCATRMTKEQAEKVVGRLGELGFVGELIGLRFAKTRWPKKQE